MAKKDLAGLVGGIIGKPANATHKAAHSIPAATEKNNAGEKTKAAEIRATFVCDPEQIRKLKYIGLASGRLHKDIVAEAFADYIGRWEAVHGEIVLPPAER